MSMYLWTSTCSIGGLELSCPWIYERRHVLLEDWSCHDHVSMNVDMPYWRIRVDMSMYLWTSTCSIGGLELACPCIYERRHVILEDWSCHDHVSMNVDMFYWTIEVVMTMYLWTSTCSIRGLELSWPCIYERRHALLEDWSCHDHVSMNVDMLYWRIRVANSTCTSELI